MLLPTDPIASFVSSIPNGIAISFGDRSVSWRELDDLTQRAATYLDLNAPENAIILLQSWNAPEFISLREAVYRTGRIFGAISPAAPDAEVAHVLALTNAALFFRSPSISGSIPAIHLGDAFQPLAKMVPDRRTNARTLLLTSGTTGLPKACLRPVSADFTRMQSTIASYGLHAGQKHLVATPLYHSGPSIFQRTHMALGSTTFLDEKFNAAKVWGHVARGEANTAFFVPTHFHRLLRDDPGTPAEYIQTWWMAGAPAAPALKESVIRRMGEGKLWEFLGSSETGTVSVMPPAGHLAHRGSVGQAPKGVDIRIYQDDGTPCSPGEIGLIYVKSGMLMQGYLGADAPAALWRDGYLSVGDLGYLDTDGYLYLSDRRTDLIISGGVNVYPAEVEAAILAFPGVQAAAVIGEPDAEWGATLTAVIAEFHPLDLEALRNHLKIRLAPAKRPKRVVVWPEIPHNAIGKPLRGEVRKIILKLKS